MARNMAAGFAVLLGVLLFAPLSTSAKTKDPCKKADALLARTGEGDTDGDGISDCRENKILGTFPNDSDSDDDQLDDGAEMRKSCDPLNHDTDDDGIDDGEDDSPAVEQKVEALLDAVTCPLPGVPGSITALGVTALLNDATEFEDVTCAELATRLGGGESLFVEIEILEDVLGALTATDVDLAHHDHEDDDQGDDSDDD